MWSKSVYTGLILMVIIFATLLHGTESRKHENRISKSKQRHAEGFTLKGGELSNITRLQYVNCNIVCDGDKCTKYICPDGYVCCTSFPHPPLHCCQDSHPLCCGENCCDSGALCCGNDCCDKSEICCGGNDCCEHACCTDSCCKDNESCCGGKECCNDASSICCDNNGCHAPCTSQFDELPCGESLQMALNIQMATSCPYISTYVYRIIRPDEDPKVGLLAKNKDDNKSPDSHVGCGSRTNYTSQFISLTTSIDIAQSYYNVSKAKGLSPRIAMVKYDDVKQNAETIYDFNIPGIRAKYLLNEINRNNSANACEIVVVNRDKPIPFTIFS